MSRIRLTDRSVATLKADKQTDIYDTTLPAFGVRVNPGGRLSWFVRYRPMRTAKHRREMLGRYPDVTLADARDRARAKLRAADRGLDPAEDRRAAEKRTFDLLADSYLEYAKTRKRTWRADQTVINRELLPAWTGRPVVSLRRADVRSLLDGIVGRGAPVKANRVLALVRRMLNFAVRELEWAEGNVAAGLSRPAKERSRDRVLTIDELRRVWLYLDASDPPAALDAEARAHWDLLRAWHQMRVLTLQRGSEVLGLRWSEIDAEAKTWTLTGARTKAGRLHVVPLSPAALTVLQRLRDDGAGTDGGLVFAGIQGTRQRSGGLDGLEIVDMRAHDFRRTGASVLTGVLGVPRLVVAKILNHADSSVTAVYDRTSYLPEMRGALEQWARWVESIAATAPGAIVQFSEVG
jgi:integrase